MFQRGANAILPVALAGNGTALPLPTVFAEQTTGLVSTSEDVMFDAAGYFGCNRTKHRKQPQSAMSYSMCRPKVAAIRTTAACSGLLTPDVTCDTVAVYCLTVVDVFVGSLFEIGFGSYILLT